MNRKNVENFGSPEGLLFSFEKSRNLSGAETGSPV